MEVKRSLPTKPQSKKSVEEKEIEGELFLIDADDGSCPVHTLNSGAALIWYLCDGTRDLGTIAKEISEFCGAEEGETLPDVSRAVSALHERGLLEA